MIEKYNASAIENELMEKWEKAGVYKFDPSRPRGEVFAIDTPPPTVSGHLHIGHIMSYTQAEILARFQRMNGKNLFFPIGWDDNGLPTERRVQNYFGIKCDPTLPYDPDFKPAQNEKSDSDEHTPVSRRNFIEACRMLIDKDEMVFESVFRRMGFSYDWGLKYSTISDLAIRIAQENFIGLYNKGYVKSVEAPTMWDTGLQSAVAQAEIEDREIPGFFHDIRFKCGDDGFVIATTRPEFLPACIAVVAHPDDERYKKFIGKTATVPLFNAEVPVYGDPHADPEKGTGIMMVCTFGDADDVKFWKEHGLPLKQIIGRDGKIVDSEWITKKEIVGLPIKAARKQIVEWLAESGDLASEPRPITHAVKFFEKGHLPIEFVPSRQWFVVLMDKKDALKKKGAEIGWTPAHMEKRLENWIDGLNQDWAVSRQRFFGVPFPVWYRLDAAGEPLYDDPIIAAKLPCDPLAECPDGFNENQRGQPNGFTGDPDVMDTWATSSLSPQIAEAIANVSLGAFDARPQAHDIIRTWAFYTIAQSLMNKNDIPWKQAWISGFVLDPDRKKMSKSKGNVVVPDKLIETYGADAVRLWAGSTKLGTDGIADEKTMDQKKKLVMKFFNAAKFVFGIVGDKKGGEIADRLDLDFMNMLSCVAKNNKKSFLENDYANALLATEQAFWDFCDNYLEIVKGRAYAGDGSAIGTLILALETFAKMFAPFMPFITDHVWSEWHGTSVHSERYPELDFNGDIRHYAEVSELVKIVRGKKTEAGKSVKAPIKKLAVADNEFFRAAETDIRNVLSVEELVFSGAETIGELVWE